jgi:hypothetical protein
MSYIINQQKSKNHKLSSHNNRSIAWEQCQTMPNLNRIKRESSTSGAEVKIC